MRNQQTTDNRLELAMTYSAYREMELVPRTAADHVSEAILDLAQNPRPEEAVMLEDAKGCYYLAVDGLSVLLVLLTALLTPISILSTWTAVEERVKDFMRLPRSAHHREA